MSDTHTDVEERPRRITLVCRIPGHLSEEELTWSVLREVTNEVRILDIDRITWLAKFRIEGGGIQAPGWIVLRRLSGHASAARYATHFYNDQDGGYHNGHYFGHDETDPNGLDLAKAWLSFGERCVRRI